MSYNNEKVESSNVESIAYSDKSKQLEVSFKNGRTYTYYDVPKSVGNAMPYTASKGQYVWQALRGQYRYSRS